MSVKEEIKNSLKNFNASEDGGGISAEFTFGKGFSGFQGHFPGNPILPGVCQIEMVLAVLEKALKHKMTLKTLDRGKYVNAVKPDETVRIAGTYSESSNGAVSAKFTLSKLIGEKPTVSRLSLTAEKDGRLN
jgi:3-hydroxyacyl-[acyl-carrier-protein] dehydratase